MNLKKIFQLKLAIFTFIMTASVPCILAGIQYTFYVLDKETGKPIDVRAVVYYETKDGIDSAMVPHNKSWDSTHGTTFVLPLTKNKFRVHIIPIIDSVIWYKEVQSANGLESGKVGRSFSKDDDSYYTEWIDIDLTEEEREGGVYVDEPVYFRRKVQKTDPTSENDQ